MICDLTDFKCIFINELIGDPVASAFIVAALFYAFCSVRRIGTKTVIWLSVFFIPLDCYYIAGSSAAFAFLTLGVGVMLALLQARIIGNR